MQSRSDYLIQIAGEVAGLGGWEVDMLTRRVHWSDEICRIHDVPPGTSPTLTQALNYYPPKWRQKILDAFEACVAHGLPFDEELEIVTATGKMVWVRAVGRAVTENGKNVKVQGAFLDLSSVRKFEKALTESESRFQEFARAMPHKVWTATPEGKVDFSTGILQADDPPGWACKIAPEDRERVRTCWNEAVRTGARYEIEMRLLDRDCGQFRWHRVTAVPSYDEHGRVKKWYGSAIDIHEVVSLSRRLTTTLESITDAFFLLDTSWCFAYVNREAQSLLQRHRDELLGRCVWESFPEAVGTQFYTRYHEAMAERRPVEFEQFFAPLNTWFQVRAFPSDDGLAVYFRDVTKKRETDQRIQHLAYHDPVTGLANRSNVLQCLEDMQAQSEAGYGAVLFLDLDNFKELNDSYGHDQGDILLAAVARRLKHSVRRGDVVARIGGDEFVVLLSNLHADHEGATATAQGVAEKILRSLDAPCRIGQVDYTISGSIGVTAFHGASVDSAEVMKQADLAMYEAKSQGKNGARTFQPAMQEKMASTARLHLELKEALKQHQFVLHYQPQADCSGKIVGMEGLVRWQHPALGLIAPSHFIKAAEDSGLITRLGRCLMKKAFLTQASWRSSDERKGIRIALNVSAREFADQDFTDTVLRLLEETRADPCMITLELTESVLIRDANLVRRHMDVLKDAGLRFSLDDFGTGYSSLAYLRSLPIDEIKIDRSFVVDADVHPDAGAIVRSIISVAHALEMDVVAEGVETQQQWDFLRRQGCTLFQGFLFGRPEPVKFDELVDFSVTR